MALTKLSTTEFQTGAITTDKFSGDVALSVRIANVSIANSTYTVLDDTAVNVGGGYIVVTGAGFQSGAQVIINETPATSTTFVSSTELRAQVGAKSAATYDVYVVNPDGGNAISVNGITYSGLPTWVTGSTLDAQNVDVAFNVSLSATGATSYANTTALPAGTTLLSNGYFYGTVTGIESETTYNFTVRATDAENQDSDREFSLTVSPVVLSAPTSVEYLVVAGGGGGGKGSFAGGGGGGGFRTSTNFAVPSGSAITVIVGSGGAGSTATGSTGYNGSDSSFSSITSLGGGGAGSRTNNGGQIGGSGGGGSRQNGPGAAGTAGQGNAGGNGAESGGGGGGAGGSGGTGSASSSPFPNPSGYGGSGGNSSITGTTIAYAGGGGGGGGASGGAGGQGGGGAGGSSASYGGTGAFGQPGTTNTGGGGGGDGEGGPGGSGGSGVVIIRYADTYADAVSTTGLPTYTNTGGYKIYKFTGSGSITW